MKRAGSLILALIATMALSLWTLAPVQATSSDSSDVLQPCGVIAGHHCATLSFTMNGGGAGMIQTTDASYTTPDGLINCTRSGGITGGSCSHSYSVPDGGSIAVYYRGLAATGSEICASQCTFGPAMASIQLTQDAQTNWDIVLSNPIFVTVVVAGSGTVTSEPFGISCGTSCSFVFGAGLPLTLTAAPATGSVFVGWGYGICDHKPATCTFSPSASVMLSASFAETPKPTPKPTPRPTATPAATPTPTPTPTVPVVSAAPIVTAGPSLAPVAIAANPSASSGPSVQPVAASSGSDLTPLAIGTAAIVVVGIGAGLAIGLRRRQA